MQGCAINTFFDVNTYNYGPNGNMKYDRIFL